MTVAQDASSVQQALPHLFLGHVTNLASFKKMIISNSIAANSKCPENKDRAAYLFYGAPFYRFKERPSISEVDEYPIGIMFPSLDLADLDAHVYPFDTGAKQAGMYEPIISKTEELDNYRLSNDKVAANSAKLVSLFFETNTNYIDFDTTQKPDSSSVSTYTGKVWDLQKSKTTKADARRGAIEIISFQDVPIPSHRVVIIGPRLSRRDLLKEINEVKKYIESPEVETLYYNVRYGDNQRDECLKIEERALDWLRDKGII